MKKRLSRKQMFFNKINLTKDDDVYVGIDAHKESYSVAIWLNDAPAIISLWSILLKTRIHS